MKRPNLNPTCSCSPTPSGWFHHIHYTIIAPSLDQPLGYYTNTSEYPPISVRQISLLVDREFDLCAKRETIPVTLANIHPMLRFQERLSYYCITLWLFIRHNLTAVTRISLNARSTVVNKTTYLNHEGIYKKTREWISVTVGTKRRFPNLEMNDLHDVLSLRI